MTAPLKDRVEQAAPKAKEKTAYHVLEEVDQAGAKTYRPVEANVRAANARDAIKAAINGAPGVYVAVPSRSWQPVKVTVRQTTQITLT